MYEPKEKVIGALHLKINDTPKTRQDIRTDIRQMYGSGFWFEVVIGIIWYLLLFKTDPLNGGYPVRFWGQQT